MSYDIHLFAGTVGSGVSPMEVVPVLPPQSGEKQPECATKWLLELLLTFMVSEVCPSGCLNIRAEN